MNSSSHTYYQAQLPHDHLFTNNKKQLLAKYWIESNLGVGLRSNNFHESLVDGEILCKIIDYLVDHGHLSNEEYRACCDLKDPIDKINLFLKAAKDFGLQSYHLFSVNDLITGDNMNNVASTILILAHVYSCKRLAGKSIDDTSSPKRSQSHTIQLSSLNPICKSKSEADLYEQGSTQEQQPHKEQPINTQPPSNNDELIGEPPYDIERPNCVPGFSSSNDQSSIHSDYDDMYDSHSPSISGDSGYGTTRNKPNKDLFEALFAPTTTTTTTTTKHGRLSLLFSKAKKEQPHFVKYQTWNNVPKSSVSSSVRPQQEKTLYQNNLSRTKSFEWQNKLLPPVIQVVDKPTTITTQQQQQRARRSTDASLLGNSMTVKQHVRSSRSIGSSLDTELLTNNLDLYDDDNNQLIASYKLGNVIGKGHFGTVYRALDLVSGNTVAIKQVSLKDARESDIEDMMQEASLLKSLTHSNIVKYEGFIQTATHMNIVLEYVENGSLLHTLKHFGNSLPEHLVASYCYDILQGLAYLHEKDVVHCDLKAANILTTKTGDVKLSDFGVSLNLKLRKNQQDNMVAGTPFWMSPEVIELKGATVQSDIWSLGCTIIELCTGKPPYADLLTMTAMFKIVEDDTPPIPDGLSDDLTDFLKLCFKKNPIERPKAMHLLYHPWILQHAKSHPELILQQQQQQQQVNSNSRKSYFQTKSISKSFIHKHNLTICSFPSGTVQCKLCNMDIHNEAYVCKDFCGYISHCACYSQSLREVPTTTTLLSRGRRISDTGGLPTIKPTSSVSTQLKEKFSSFGRKSRTLSHIMEDKTTSWWKKRNHHHH